MAPGFTVGEFTDTFQLPIHYELSTKVQPFIVILRHDAFILSLSQLSVTMTVELSMSYYNDHLNEWEQLLERLPEDKNRFWSLQLDFNSCDQKDLFDKKDWKNMSTLQSSCRTLSIVSQDNLELTLSKTALDVLSKLGRVSCQPFGCCNGMLVQYSKYRLYKLFSKRCDTS